MWIEVQNNELVPKLVDPIRIKKTESIQLNAFPLKIKMISPKANFTMGPCNFILNH